MARVEAARYSPLGEQYFYGVVIGMSAGAVRSTCLACRRKKADMCWQAFTAAASAAPMRRPPGNEKSRRLDGGPRCCKLYAY
jgi:hypothetical protein